MSNTIQDLYQSQFGEDGADQNGQPQGEITASEETGQQYDLQQMTSTASALFSIAAAGVRAGDLEKQAGDQLIAADAEETAALQRSNAILERQMQVSGSLRAAFAASGVDLGSATVQHMDRENRSVAQDALQKVRNTGARRAASRRYAARALARRAAESFGAGVIDAFLTTAQSMASAGASGGGG